MDKLSLLKEWVISVIRTSIAPFIAAWLVQIVIINISLLDFFSLNQVTWAVTVVLSAVWYALFRWIELVSKNPKVEKWAGILLGYPRIKVEMNP